MAPKIVDDLLKTLVTTHIKNERNNELTDKELIEKHSYLFSTSKEILNGMPKKKKVVLSNLKVRIQRILERINKKDEINDVMANLDSLIMNKSIKNPLIIAQFIAWLSLYNNSKSKISWNSLSEVTDIDFSIEPTHYPNSFISDLNEGNNLFKAVIVDKMRRHLLDTQKFKVDDESPSVNRRHFEKSTKENIYNDENERITHNNPTTFCDSTLKSIRNRLPKDCLLISDSVSFKPPILYEHDLLRDILLVMQSLNGKYIRFSVDCDRYLLPIDVKVSISVKEILMKLSEMGYMCKKLNGYINAKSNSKSCQLVTKGIIFYIKSELLEYSKEISGWDSMQTINLCNLSNDTSINENQNNFFNTQSQCGNSTKIEPLTLRKLYVMSRYWAKRLNYIYLMLEFISGRTSGAKLSGIRNYTYCGDELCLDVSSKMLASAYRPIGYILHQFISKGYLNDQFCEFFVATNKNCSPTLFWKKKFTLKTQLIPNFISSSTAYKILMIGKSIGFIRIIQEELNKRHFKDTSMTTNDFIDCSQPVNYIDDIYNIDKIITPIYISTSRILLDLVMNQLELDIHLKAINDYLLLGRGDFVLYLMHTIMRNEKDNKFLAHNIAAILETTIRSTTAQFDPVDVIQRIDCRIYDKQPNFNMLELFTLDYRVDGPLSTIFNRKIMKCYRNVFTFLWKIKYLETSLSQMWFNLSRKGDRVLTDKFSPTIHQMLFFVNQLQYFIMFEVIECHRNTLTTKIHSATDLDMIIKAHNVYLQKITQYCFLDGTFVRAKDILTCVFDDIFSLEKIYAELKNQYDSFSICNKDIQSINNADKLFKKNVCEFVQFLHNHSDITMKSLGFRINYNKFFVE